uniref:Proteasome assembly chaperone 4 n=1 Tax=Felis catus TaxID=9685 RepID=A0ABI7ZM61_FELCA
MDGPPAAAGGDVSLHNFSARLWEQLVHFHVMRLTDSLFLWVGATPHLRNLAVAMCNRYDSIPVSTSLLGDTSDTTSSGLAQRLDSRTVDDVKAVFPEAPLHLDSHGDTEAKKVQAHGPACTADAFDDHADCQQHFFSRQDETPTEQSTLQHICSFLKQLMQNTH